MKTTGKIAVLIMMLSAVFALSACGGSASSSTSSASSSSAASSSSSAASSVSSSSSVSLATLEGDTYTNETFGIVFNLPSGWTFTDVSGLKGIGGIVETATKEAELDMMALKADSSQLVVIDLETPNSTNSGMSAEQYLEAQVEKTKAGLDGTYTYTTTSASMSFDGMTRELPAAVTNLDVNGAKLVICQVVDQKDGNFLNIIAMAGSEEEVTKTLENFKAIR